MRCYEKYVWYMISIFSWFLMKLSLSCILCFCSVLMTIQWKFSWLSVSSSIKWSHNITLLWHSYGVFLAWFAIAFPNWMALAPKELICSSSGFDFSPTRCPDTLLTRVATYTNEEAGLVTNHLTMEQVELVYMVPVAGLVGLWWDSWLVE